MACLNVGNPDNFFILAPEIKNKQTEKLSTKRHKNDSLLDKFE